MSKEKFAAAKQLIQEKQYDEARVILRTIDHPTARSWERKLDEIAPQLPQGVTEKDREQARMKSYTVHVIIVIILYLFLFIPGLIANVIFHNEGKRMEIIAGQPLPGVGALGFMRKWLFVILIVSLILLVIFLLPLLKYA